ncbi:DUF1016 family protein [Caenimonas sedimenti]|uniref:DUF1016 family protein n=1 Tax=Caenimonas sedimenti TaxID=2596921 RepID=A0A562ZSU0_9BURK|nr:endonuclease NucS domain-containing protein [Caenimonas sedimenti]TWO71441.1 DUF1016 family protein [Caenimonas sedimenti]
MARTIYDKPTRLLLNDMIAAWSLKPGEVFTSGRAIDWFAGKYPKLRPGSIRAHLVQAATNDQSRLHHSPSEADDLFFKVGPSQFRLYEPGKDPAPIREKFAGDVAQQEATEPEQGTEDAEARPGSSQFLWEKDLQQYLSRNLEILEPGLRLYEEDNLKGIEFDAGGRFIDLLAVDKTGALVVIELKVSKGYDRVVGQLLRYVNYVRRELAAPGQRVRGIIICRNMTEDLRLACASIPDVELYEYQLSVTVQRVEALPLPK